MGAGEGIDAVVVRPVRKSGQLVEQLLAVPAADELDQPVLGRRRHRLGADQLAAGHPLAEDPVAAEELAGVALDQREPGSARLPLDPDRHCEAVAGGGRGDQPLDRTGCLALADDVCDV
ncbi:MAG: hypothetical protein M3P15_08335, partial [Actinomycetota bacterium]|nr:hypothetical protein [Actinomycetota bacterium]